MAKKRIKQRIQHDEPAYNVRPGQPTPIDELCVCGRLRSQHGADTVETKTSVIEIGNAGSGGRGCDRFTWIAFIFEKTDPRYVAAKGGTPIKKG